MRSILELELSSMAHGGEALGRYEGKVVFVGYAIPGERVRVEVVEDHRRWSRARLLEVLEPSPHRVTPPCPYFGTCGGCQWQHIEYEAQLALKGEVLRDQLQRLGHFADLPVAEVIPSPNPWRYRNQLQLSIAPDGGAGFLDASGARMVPIETCLLPHPLVWEMVGMMEMEGMEGLLQRLRLRAGIRTGEQMMVFETEGDIAPGIEVDVPISCVLLEDGRPVNLIGRNWLTEELAGRRFRISAGSFFQVNTPQAERLIELVGQFLDPQGNETLLDLYCGVGTFALSLAHRVKRVIGVESHGPAVADAWANAHEDEPVEFIEGKVEEVLPQLDLPLDAVIVDPPRGGCGSEVLGELIRLSPSKLIYVSCDPAILARDARLLADAGYHLERVQPVDMFPQTYHIESVSLFLR
ncbi:MAG: 23S rRNA (uracil(1939)-C(5))-methyltransferase RlmD [Chloroflexota bacterium]|nr:23S rRNA (uracil(1939)-C(5))-methyltransferase RlmD [Chloroflexota bacterium]